MAGQLKPGHFEAARSKRKVLDYVTKEDTRMAGTQQVSAGVRLPKRRKVYTPKDPLEGKTLRRWQADLKDSLLDAPDDRTIYWFWDYSGGTGKTAFAKHRVLSTQQAMYVQGGARDIAYALGAWIDSTCSSPREIYIDIPRAGMQHVSYPAIEGLKNGILFSSKYESRQIVFDTPHVIVFANEQPDTSKLSSDRWKITELNDN